MSKSTKQPDVVLTHMNPSNLGPIFELPLDQIKSRPEDFRHRDDADLNVKSESMKDLMNSLTTEGLQEPLIVHRDDNGSYVQTTGHRRRAAIEALADANVGNFKRDMPVIVREQLNGSRHDHLLHSVMDNVVREQIDELHKTKAAVHLITEGVDHTRIKSGLRLSDSTFDRYRRLAANPWMLEHVERGELGLTTAHALLEAAGGQGGTAALEYLRKDLNREITAVQVKINAKKADLASKDKEISKADATVKTYFPPHLVKAWVGALKRGERLPRQAKFKYGAGVVRDRAGKRLTIPAVTLPLNEGELERLAEVLVVLDKTLKDARPEVNALARQRKALQSYAESEIDGPADYTSAGLDAVDEVLNPKTRSTDPLTEDDWLDRERTREEVNKNYAREDQAREVTPATTGLAVADAQPMSDCADDAEIERMLAVLAESNGD